MESPKNEFSQDPFALTGKNNPFRKSTYNTKSSASSLGSDSPNTSNMKKSKVRDNHRNQHQPDQIVEEDVQQQTPRPEEPEENDLAASNLVISTSFTPMAIPVNSGVKTTKVSISPIKPVGYTPKTVTNAKANDDALLNSLNPKKFGTSRSKSKILASPSRVFNDPETKLTERQTKRNKEKDDSFNNLEKKESFKQEIPSHDSLDLEENPSKKKKAFITDNPDLNSSSGFNKKRDRDNSSDRSYEYDSDEMDNLSQDSANLNKPQGGVKQIREPRTESKAVPKYDPYAVINKVRGRRLDEADARELFHTRSVDNRFDASPKNSNPQMHLANNKVGTSQPRDFTVLRSKKMNLFEGIPYVPYDVFLRQDTSMQNVMIKDLLKILFDKAKSLKNLLHDSYRMDRIMKNIEEAEQSALNLHTEETVGLINAVASLVMQEFRDSIDKIGIKPSPIFDNPDLKLFGFENEVERFNDNCTIFLDTIDHLRDCIDCYYVMSRQKDRKPMPEADCSDLLQFIARARYNLGQLYEAFRVIEKHVDAKLHWLKENNPMKNRNKFNSKHSASDNKLKADTYKLLNELLHNKFNINKNKLAATRESKVILNQEAEDEKLLMILQNQKQLKKKGARTLGDNRKLIILNRLLNPIEDPQIHAAMKVAQEKTQVQLSRDLVEYMASKSKTSGVKVKPTKDAPLKDNLEKILSNKKLTNLCFDFEDGKEKQEILTALSTKNKGLKVDDVVSSVFGHAKTKRHLGCLFEKEALKNGGGKLVESKAVKLPTLQNPPHKLQTR